MKNLINKLLGTKPKPPIQPVVAKVCEMILAGDYKTEVVGSPQFGYTTQHTFSRGTVLPVCVKSGCRIYVGNADIDMTTEEEIAVRSAFKQRYDILKAVEINKALPEILAYKVKEHAP